MYAQSQSAQAAAKTRTAQGTPPTPSKPPTREAVPSHQEIKKIPIANRLRLTLETEIFTVEIITPVPCF
jgi:hypothetical protein